MYIKIILSKDIFRLSTVHDWNLRRSFLIYTIYRKAKLASCQCFWLAKILTPNNIQPYILLNCLIRYKNRYHGDDNNSKNNNDIINNGNKIIIITIIIILVIIKLVTFLKTKKYPEILKENIWEFASVPPTIFPEVRRANVSRNYNRRQYSQSALGSLDISGVINTLRKTYYGLTV